MWSSVLVLALVTVPDPPRLIATFLVLSRPRPGKNLLAYYVGCLILNVFILLVPLTVVHFTPALGSLVRDLTPAATEANATVQPVPLALGVLALLIAARLTMRLRARKKEAIEPTPGSDAQPAPAQQSALSRLLDADDGSSGAGSAIRRLIARIYKAWQEGSPWIALLMGLTYSPLQTTAALAIIATSGASLGAQLGAAIAFVAIMLAVLEVILIGYLVAPAKTEALVGPMHNWTQAHILHMFIGISLVGGVLLIAKGVSVV
jgi:hypothetical protein